MPVMVDTMDNITTLHPVNTLTVGEVISPTTSAYRYTVLAASLKYAKSEGTRAVWVVLHINADNTHSPFATHLAVDTENGWAFESGHYYPNLTEALADYAKRSGQVG